MALEITIKVTNEARALLSNVSDTLYMNYDEVASTIFALGVKELAKTWPKIEPDAKNVLNNFMELFQKTEETLKNENR